jgi:hypothetical protein
MTDILERYLLDVNVLTGKPVIRELHYHDISREQALTSLKSDNGGEFTGKAFRDLCKRHGIRQVFTGPFAPQQNGLAERSNRTVIEMTRCLLKDSQAPRHLWAEATNTAVYIINRCPTKPLRGDTPYHALHGTPANLSHMHIFGSPAWLHVYDHQRKKLDDKSWQGILVGYDPSNPKCYRIYNPKTQKVQHSVHVTFYRFSIMTTPDLIHSERAPSSSVIIIEDDDGYERPSQLHGPAPIAPAPAPPADELLVHDDSDPCSDDSDTPVEPRRNPTRTARQSRGHEAHTRLTIPRSHSTPPQHGTRVLPAEVLRLKDWHVKDPSLGTTTRTQWCEDPNCVTLGHHKAHLSTHYAYAVEGGIDDPHTYHEALTSDRASEWQRAMEEEFQSFGDTHTWERVYPPTGANIIKCKWVYKAKKNEKGEIVRYKARLVAKGFTQVYGQDYTDTFSPVTRMTSMRTFLAIAAMNDWELENLDVDTAFLNADIEEEIFLQQPEGFV